MNMVGAKNRKLCWNCEGSVHVHATKCPYCGTDLSSEQAPTQTTYSYGKPPEPTLTSPPPKPVEVPPPAPQVKKPSPDLLPMLLLLPGAFFLFFGMILLFFSNDGTLSLEWNAHYWFFYLLLAAPLIYYGWRTLNRREAQPEAVPIRKEEDELPPPPPGW